MDVREEFEAAKREKSRRNGGKLRKPSRPGEGVARGEGVCSADHCESGGGEGVGRWDHKKSSSGLTTVCRTWG